MSISMRDVAVARRTLARSRGFTITAILSLGLAIALGTTVYSLIDALLFPPIGVRDPHELYQLRYFGDVHHRLPKNAIDSALATGVYGYRGVTGFQWLAQGHGTTVEHGARYRIVQPLVVRSNLFALLGARPIEGRTFMRADETAETPVAVISDRLAAELFPGGAPAVGNTILVDGMGARVIGTVRRDIAFAALNTDCWLLRRVGDARGVPISMIRLATDVKDKRLDAELETLAARLAIAAGDAPGDSRFYISGRSRRPLEIGRFHWALIGSVVVILLVACGNLATLQLARGLTRGPEIALRAALGASRRQIVAMLTLENALLAGGGLALGSVLTVWAVHVLRATIPAHVAGYLVEPTVNLRVFGAASLVTVLALALVGLLPALAIARVDPNTLLKQRTGTGAHRRHRMRYALMIALQIALGLPLVSGGALLIRSTVVLGGNEYLTHEVFGYDPRPLVRGQLSTTPVGVIDGKAALAPIASQTVGRLRTLDDVADAAVVASVPPKQRGLTIITADGAWRDVPAPMWTYSLVSPSFFRTFHRAMVAGSDFVEGAYGVPAVIIDQPTAHYLWPNVDPIGRLIKFADVRTDAPWARVVGVVGDQRDTSLMRLMDPANGYRLGQVYRVFSAQDSAALGHEGVPFVAYVRAKHDAQQTALTVTHALRGMPGANGVQVSSLDERYGLVQRRAQIGFVALLFTVFAVVALGLAAVGVYGIVSHSVNERRREFGVRISLGATPRHILHDVLREGSTLALGGIALGLFFTKDGVYWIALFMSRMNDIFDAVLFAEMALVLAVTVALAALLPALRATRVNPVEAMRND